MKQENQNSGKIILVLLALLMCSIILNFIQGNFIDELILQIRELEYIQSVTPYQIEETENMEDLKYEAK